VSVNSKFTVNVTLADVSNLFGFQFYLSYNTTLLDFVAITVFPPFENSLRINETEGYIYVRGSLHTGHEPLSGSFPLASITFVAASLGSCTLHLYDTVLLDPALTPIDHTTTDGSVNIPNVTIPGDVDGNGKVDMRDIGLICMAYGSYPGHPKWNPNADINDDGKVDMRDIGIACMHYGQHE
jgi:hypothetical protein